MDKIMSNMSGLSSPMESNIFPTVDDDLQYIDICKLIKGREPYELPDLFYGLEQKTRILTELKLIAMKCGFVMIHNLSKV